VSPETPSATEQHDDDGEGSDRDRQRDRSIVLAVTIAILSVLVAAVGIWRVYVTTDFLTFWAKWNYSGYKPPGAKPNPKVNRELKAPLGPSNELPRGARSGRAARHSVCTARRWR